MEQIWSGPHDQGFAGATPSMTMEGGFESIVWRVLTSNPQYSSGLYLWTSALGMTAEPIGGTGSGSAYPSTAAWAYQDNEGHHAVAWADAGQIYFRTYTYDPDKEEFTMGSLENPSALSYCENHDYPSLVFENSSNGRPVIAWHAYDDTYLSLNVILVCRRESGGWQTFQQYVSGMGENNYHPSLIRYEVSSNLALTWFDEITYMYNARYNGSWGSRTTLSVNGTNPSLGYDDSWDNTHFRVLYTSYGGPPYALSTTSQGLPKQGATDMPIRALTMKSSGGKHTVILKSIALGSTSAGFSAWGDTFSVDNLTAHKGFLGSGPVTVPTSGEASLELIEAAEPLSGRPLEVLPVDLFVKDHESGSDLLRMRIDTLATAEKSSKRMIYGANLKSLAGRRVTLNVVPSANIVAAAQYGVTLILSDTSRGHSEPPLPTRAAASPPANALLGSYPNPFNPQTTIRYQLSAPGAVRLTIYDMLGREVARLVNAVQPIGSSSVDWNARGVASGVYLARLTVSDESGRDVYRQIQKLVLAR